MSFNRSIVIWLSRIPPLVDRSIFRISRSVAVRRPNRNKAASVYVEELGDASEPLIPPGEDGEGERGGRVSHHNAAWPQSLPPFGEHGTPGILEGNAVELGCDYADRALGGALVPAMNRLAVSEAGNAPR